MDDELDQAVVVHALQERAFKIGRDVIAGASLVADVGLLFLDAEPDLLLEISKESIERVGDVQVALRKNDLLLVVVRFRFAPHGDRALHVPVRDLGTGVTDRVRAKIAADHELQLPGDALAGHAPVETGHVSMQSPSAVTRVVTGRWTVPTVCVER